jgi:hypothetical protein
MLEKSGATVEIKLRRL